MKNTFSKTIYAPTTLQVTSTSPRSSVEDGKATQKLFHTTNLLKYLFWLSLVCALLVGAYLRIIFADTDRTIIQGDEYTYHNAAKSIIDRGYMVRNPFIDKQEILLYKTPTAALSPGYPAFIATIYSVTENSISAVLSVQVAISIATLILILLVLLELKVRRDAIVLCLLLSALYPGFIYNNDRMLTEHLFMFLSLGFATAFIIAMRTGSMLATFLAAILITCAIHTRAQAIPFSILAIVFLLIYGRGNISKRTAQTALFSACAIITMTPYWIYNYETLGRIIFLPETGEGPMIWGAVPYFLDMPSTTNVPLAETISANSTPAPAIYWKWRVFGYIQQMWGDVWDENIVHAQSLLRPWLLLQHFLIIPTIAAIPFLARKSDPRIMFIAAFPLAMTYMNAPFHGLPRYAFPSIPFVLIISAVLLGSFIDKFQPRRRLQPMTDGETKSKIGDKVIRLGLLSTSILLSVILLYSTYVFSWGIHMEMSAYRLARYMGTSPTTVTSGRPIASFIFGPEQLPVGNATKITDGVYNNNINGPALVSIPVPATPKNIENSIVTKVVFNISGGFAYDFMTVYWKSPKVIEFSENHVYPRFPINFMEDSQTIFVDDDVTELLIVPAGFRGGTIHVKSVEITKYDTTNP